jgi:hypothetical protein
MQYAIVQLVFLYVININTPHISIWQVILS